MAPEVVALNRAETKTLAGKPADVFSFGITLAELLAPAQRPYAGVPRFDLPRRVRSGEKPTFVEVSR